MRWRVAPRAGRTHNAYTTCTRTDWEHVFGRVSNLCVGLDIFCGPVGSGRVRFCLSGPQACNIYHILRSTHLWFSCQGARRDDFDYILRLALRPPPPPLVWKRVCACALHEEDPRCERITRNGVYNENGVLLWLSTVHRACSKPTHEWPLDGREISLAIVASL